jgi:hypothetical protein
MRSSFALSLAGFLAGGVIGMFFVLLFLDWPVRTLGLALVLIATALLLLWRGQTPSQGAILFAAWFSLGFALSLALISILDMIFPPIT